jgi:hypothetical protein
MCIISCLSYYYFSTPLPHSDAFSFSSGFGYVPSTVLDGPLKSAEETLLLRAKQTWPLPVHVPLAHLNVTLQSTAYKLHIVSHPCL